MLLAAMLLLSVGFAKLQAQNFPGYRSGNYTGVNGVFFNPANIADSRYRWDVNLFSFNGYVGNNKADFNLKDLAAANTDKFKNNFLQGNGNINALTNAEILGPSGMFNLNKKSSMAISTRFRVIGNLKDFDGNLINSIINAGNATSSFTLSTNSNSQLVTNSWGEYGLSYAREIASFGPHYIKAGITVKYLSGISNNLLQINKFKTTINADTFSQRAYFQNTSGIIQIANSGLSSGDVNFGKMFGSDNKGIGGDIVNIVSKNAVVAGPNNPGYGSAKAAQAHLSRLMAAELGPDKIRVNTVNPDAVISDSNIWAGGWAEGRAKAYGVTVEELPAYYAKRTLLNEIILPLDIANACFALVGGLLNKSTGNAINVDGGVAMGFYR